MPCTLCDHNETRVVRSTERADGSVRRTRQCCRCGHRWATVEITEEAALRVERVKNAAGALLEAIGRA